MQTKRVVIIDDDADVCNGLKNWLARDYVVCAYESAENFLTGIDDLHLGSVVPTSMPTCLLLDFQMPGVNGVELQEVLKAANILCPIIFMSGNAQHADIIAAWRGGAVDFVLKPFSASEIDQALAHAFATVPTVTALPITPREAQVLLLLGQGLQQYEVADALGLSVRTIKMYRTFLKNKLNLHSLMELARYCDKHQAAIAMIAQGAPPFETGSSAS